MIFQRQDACHIEKWWYLKEDGLDVFTADFLLLILVVAQLIVCKVEISDVYFTNSKLNSLTSGIIS